MKRQKDIMGMPVIINIVDATVKEEDFSSVFSYFHAIDQRFSTYKEDSEVTKINRGEITKENYSSAMKKIVRLSEETKRQTNGYFDIISNGKLDPSGLVKGFAIAQAANMLKKKEYANFYVEIAGDIQVYGKNEKGEKWRVGIRNPYNKEEIVKVLQLENNGIATSGTYIRGNHIYNPIDKKSADAIVSMTVIGSNIYDADRFATAAFAMGEKGIQFIDSLAGFEGYMITKDNRAYYTRGFEKYNTA